jgi:HK97 family phage major capsid protein
MVDAGNHRVYISADPSRSLPPTLMGIPTVFTGRTPTIGETGDVMLCDLAYYLLKTSARPFIQASEHVLFKENKTVVKTFYNVDGSHWLKKPITMRDGVTEMSPFVVLEA